MDAKELVDRFNRWSPKASSRDLFNAAPELQAGLGSLLEAIEAEIDTSSRSAAFQRRVSVAKRALAISRGELKA